MLRVPRFFAETLWGARYRPEAVLSPRVAPAPSLVFAGKLQPRQADARDAALAAYAAGGRGGAMLELPCGFGKTVIALSILASLRVRTLVLVHKEFLMDQWRERLSQFVPAARVGRLQQDCVQIERLSLETSCELEFCAVDGVGPKLAARLAATRPASPSEISGVSEKVRTRLREATEMDGCDVVLGMIHSVASRDYPHLDTFGLVVVDEAHHICASMFSKSLRKVPAPRVLGLSATPKRPDGLGFALPWFLGPVRYRAEKTYEKAEVLRIHHLPPADKQKDILTRQGKVLLPVMVTRLIAERRRMNTLLRYVADTYAEGRYLMVISERLSLLHAMRKALPANYSVGLYVGGMTAEERDVSATKRIVLATYSMCAEGLDIPRLDTLLLATPRSNVEQSLGRILRLHPDKATPRVLDVVDDFSVFQGMAHQRRRLYRKHDFSVRDVGDGVEAEAGP